MRNPAHILLMLSCSLCLQLSAQDSTSHFSLPDSVRAIQYLAEFNVISTPGKKEAYTGIRTDVVSVALEISKSKKKITFRFPRGSKVMAHGLDVKTIEGDELAWDYNWVTNQLYRLLIAVATDSAENFSLYTGYIWLPVESKWKLIGTVRIDGRWSGIKDPSVFFSNGRKNLVIATNAFAWIQRSNGSWKYLKTINLSNPVVIVTNHVDSIQQFTIDKQVIEKAISGGHTDVKANVEGVYYHMMKEGTGRPVTVNDTVVIHYKGYLFNDGSVFDQTKETPATFPLKRLIRGWQVGVPLCKVGGKIKLVIPSGLAYSIRTRAAKIPPNSILVFEIEVLDTKPPGS